MRGIQFIRPRRHFDNYRLECGLRSGRVLLIAVLAAGMGLFWGQAQAVPVPQPARSAVMMDWLDDLIEDVEDIIDDLEDAEDEAMAQTNSLRLEKYLNRVVRQIEDILDPGVYPALDEGVSGQIDASVTPETLAEYAEESVILALDAAAEIQSGEDFDQQLVATNLKTIAYLIDRVTPHSYKTKAGL